MKNLKHLTKRSLALFLALVMCLGMMQVAAFADETSIEPDDTIQNEEITGGSGQETTGEDEILNDGEDEILNNDEDEILNNDEDEILNNDEDEILNNDEDEILNDGEDEILNDGGEDEILNNDEDESLNDDGEDNNLNDGGEEEEEPATEATALFGLRANEEPETTYKVIWKLTENGEVYAEQEATELDENDRPVIEDPEDPTRQDYVFMGWTDFVSEEDGIYVTTAQWEKDILVDPTVPVAERSEWGDGIPDEWQVKVNYFINNGSFSFEGKDGLRCDAKNQHATMTPACSTVVTQRDSNGNPTSWYKGCTAKLAKEHLPIGTPDEGYSKITWSYSDYSSPGGAPAEGTEIRAGQTYMSYRLIYSDPDTKVTVTYQHNTGGYDFRKGFLNKDQWETLMTVKIDRGEWYKLWDPGVLSQDYDFVGWRPDKTVDDISPDKPFSYLGENSSYSITEDLVLQAMPGMRSSGDATITTPPSPNVTYEWGDITPTAGKLPTKIGYYKGVTVGIANGPSGIVTGTDGSKYLFKGWKLTSGTVANTLPASQIVARSVTLIDEDIVLTAQWEKYEEGKVLVKWLAGYPGAQPDVVQTAQVSKDSVITWDNGSITISGVTNPASPERPGYNFVQWSDPVKEDDGSITITAQWVEKTVTVQWVNEGTVLYTASDVKLSAIPKADEYSKLSGETEAPTKDEDDQYTYTFAGWNDAKYNEDKTVVTYNARYTPVPKQTPVSGFTMLWLDGYNSDPLQSKDYDAGSTDYENDHPNPPTRPNYTFDGWSEPVVTQTDDKGNPTSMTITAQWKENTFTVTWLNGYDGGQIATRTYGKATQAETYLSEHPANPTRPGSYRFTGWSNPVDDGNGNLTITAQWDYTGGSGGGSDPTPPKPTNPDPENPPVNIPDEQPPLTEEPTVDIPDEEPPLTEEPTVDIPDEQPPLAEEPEVEIPEEEVPLAGVPQTGEASTALWLAAALMACAGLVYVNTGKRKEENQ